VSRCSVGLSRRCRALLHGSPRIRKKGLLVDLARFRQQPLPTSASRARPSSSRDRAHQCPRAALAASSTGSVDSFSGVVTVSRPDKGLAAGRTRSIDIRAQYSSVSVAHPSHEVSLPGAPLQDASSFGLFFPGCWRSPRGQSQRREQFHWWGKRRRRAHDRPEHQPISIPGCERTRKAWPGSR
jgi:hypothetical protein